YAIVLPSLGGVSNIRRAHLHRRSAAKHRRDGSHERETRHGAEDQGRAAAVLLRRAYGQRVHTGHELSATYPHSNTSPVSKSERMAREPTLTNCARRLGRRGGEGNVMRHGVPPDHEKPNAMSVEDTNKLGEIALAHGPLPPRLRGSARRPC